MGQSFVPLPFPFLHGIRRKLLLACTPGVAVNLLRSLMPSDRHDLAVAGSKLRAARRPGFAQSMRRAMRRQPGLVTPFAEPVAKTIHREWFAELGDEIGAPVLDCLQKPCRSIAGGDIASPLMRSPRHRDISDAKAPHQIQFDMFRNSQETPSWEAFRVDSLPRVLALKSPAGPKQLRVSFFTNTGETSP